MTNGNDLVEFEERHYDELVEAFIKEYPMKWADFVEEAYQEECARVL